jgi:serine/threonine protein kinase
MSDLAGQCLGQYQILARISKGSTSTIYKAYQSKLDRFVAVKVLSPQVVDEEGFLERFTQEARAVAQLDHPNIVPVYDFDREGDVAYIVMKYVESGTLRAMMTSAPLDLGLTVDIVTQVGLALGYAHRRGVIHRDVKPSNILIGEGRWALLTDFGLAKILGGGGHITRSGIGMGTPDYMSPEQAQGLPGDGRADLYSLGATLYEMVTGRPPFKADSLMGVVVKHITKPPPPPGQFNPNLPKALESAILKALAKNPASRFQTAEAMVAAVVRGAGPVTEREIVPGADLAALSVTRPAEPLLSVASTTSPMLWTRMTDAITRAWGKVKRTGNQLKSRIVRADGFSKRQRATFGGVALAGLILLAVLGGLMLEHPADGASAPPLATATALPPATVVTPAMPTLALSPTLVRPSDTPSPTPPTPTPSPTPEWTYLSSSAPIRPGIYVKVVRPAGLDVRKAPGFETEFIVTLAVGKILYVSDGPVHADSLSWIKISDGVTTGWGVQDYVAPFGIRNR